MALPDATDVGENMEYFPGEMLVEKRMSFG